MNVPDAAVTAARDVVLADGEWIDDETLRAALEVAAPLLVAAELEAIAANYPPDVFLPDSTTRDGIAGTAIREVLTRRAASLRQETER